MKLNQILFLLFCVVSPSLLAQVDFKPGYVLINRFDTLKGEIDISTPVLLSKECHFRTNDNVVTTYYPKDIYGFRFIDGNYYVSKQLEEENVFLEMLIAGEMNIYYRRTDEGGSYYLEKEDVELTPIPYTEKIVQNDGKSYLYKSKQHVGVLGMYMQDAPQMTNRITNLEKPSHLPLIRLAEDYHNFVCEDEDCMIYYKKSKSISMDASIIFGTATIRRPDEQIRYNTYIYGISMNFYFLEINNGAFINTGFSYGSYTSDDVNDKFFMIPLLFGYRYRGPLVQPHVGLGFTFNNVSLYPTYDIGMYVIPFEKIGFSFSYHRDFYIKHNYDPGIENEPIREVKGIHAQTFSAGLVFNFD